MEIIRLKNTLQNQFIENLLWFIENSDLKNLQNIGILIASDYCIGIMHGVIALS